ncbi:Ribosomal protein L7Ae/L30e/S12e/Gadd45 [Artemisia annua]|uniref:Ribosomal protein L7Ae/L30e/S12e/Gadd45 n=1 Tax=Artemisia annua TaxID=35608 RepID=A0A2U1QCP9_ARTAN|nr:Ribosomal protein L7Ae/L30e/S12e/Gadd45 [Artemisia annua]
MAPKKGVKIATKKKTEKVVNPLFEKRQEQFDISGALPPKKDVHRFVRWPQVVRIQRKRRILKQRLKFYSRVRTFNDLDGNVFLDFWIKDQHISSSITKLGDILGVPSHGQYAYTEEHSLDSLYYHLRLKCLDLAFENLEMTFSSRCDGSLVHLDPNRLYLKKILPDLKNWELLLRENVLSLAGNRDHVPASLAHMLFCLSNEEPYNLVYYMAKRMANVHGLSDKLMPYGMLLTRLFHWVMTQFPHLLSDDYVLVNPVMKPLGGPQRRTKQRSDKGQKRSRKSTSDATLSSSSFDHGSSSQPMNEDDVEMNEQGTSHVSTPSPNTYLRDLNTSNFKTTTDLPFNNTNLGSVMRRQTVMYNRQVEMHEQTVGEFKSFGKAIKGIGKMLKKLGKSRDLDNI